jgi:hypothetical protein
VAKPSNAVADYIRNNPTHQVTVCMNVQSGSEDKRLRVAVDRLQRPYKPKNLGVFVTDTIEEALAKVPQDKPVDTKEFTSQ